MQHHVPRLTGLPLLAAIILLMPGCGETPGNGAATNATANNAAEVQAPAAKAEAPAIVLEGEGLRLIDPATTRATPLPFGTDQAGVIRALSASLGTPEMQTNQECGPGPLDTASWSKGLAAHFQDGKFVGWSGAVDLKTADRIGFGSSRAALVEAYHPTIEESSLGTEFSANGLSGVLESDAADAAISEMWAGMTCIAR